jgi:hypothetical protein
MKIGSIEISTPVCAIIRLHDGSVNPNILLQAVIDPAKVSAGGQYIRFTGDDLCEVHGWKPVEAVEIMEVLEHVVEN